MVRLLLLEGYKPIGWVQMRDFFAHFPGKAWLWVGQSSGLDDRTGPGRWEGATCH